MGKLFGTDGIRGVVNAGLDADLAYKVGLQAIAVVFHTFPLSLAFFSAILRGFIIPLSAKSLYTFSILYPMPICVWIYCGESGSDSSFLRSVAIKTRSEATSLSQELPQTSWVI